MRKHQSALFSVTDNRAASHNNRSATALPSAAQAYVQWRVTSEGESPLTIVLKALPSTESPRTLMATKATWNHKQMSVRWLNETEQQRESQKPVHVINGWKLWEVNRELFYCSLNVKAGGIFYYYQEIRLEDWNQQSHWQVLTMLQWLVN